MVFSHSKDATPYALLIARAAEWIFSHSADFSARARFKIMAIWPLSMTFVSLCNKPMAVTTRSDTVTN
jgi:hypothetical protein